MYSNSIGRQILYQISCTESSRMQTPAFSSHETIFVIEDLFIADVILIAKLDAYDAVKKNENVLMWLAPHYGGFQFFAW